MITGIAWFLMILLQVALPITAIVFIGFAWKEVYDSKNDNFWSNKITLGSWKGYAIWWFSCVGCVMLALVCSILAGLRWSMTKSELSELQQNYTYVLSGKELTFTNGKLTELSSTALTYANGTINIIMFVLILTIFISLMVFIGMYVINPSKVKAEDKKFIPFVIEKLKGGIGVVLYGLVLLLVLKLIFVMVIAGTLGVSADFTTSTFMQTFGFDGIQGLLQGTRTLVTGEVAKP